MLANKPNKRSVKSELASFWSTYWRKFSPPEQRTVVIQHRPVSRIQFSLVFSYQRVLMYM